MEGLSSLLVWLTLARCWDAVGTPGLEHQPWVGGFCRLRGGSGQAPCHRDVRPVCRFVGSAVGSSPPGHPQSLGMLGKGCMVWDCVSVATQPLSYSGLQVPCSQGLSPQGSAGVMWARAWPLLKGGPHLSCPHTLFFKGDGAERKGSSVGSSSRTAAPWGLCGPLCCVSWGPQPASLGLSCPFCTGSVGHGGGLHLAARPTQK